MTACGLIRHGAGDAQQAMRRFGTMTRDGLELAAGRYRSQVTHVALESTGVGWTPGWNLLEGQFAVVVVNAQPIKAVPGRKTARKDGQWIADRLPHGSLRGRVVPPAPVRRWRDLPRLRTS